jgi:hypothetical protein
MPLIVSESSEDGVRGEVVRLGNLVDVLPGITLVVGDECPDLDPASRT